MKTLSFSRVSFTLFAVVASVVLAVSTPVATANAQIAMQQAVAQLKYKITTVIDTNISKLQKTQDSLQVSITANRDGMSGSVSANGNGASGSVNKDGATGAVNEANGSGVSNSVNKDGASSTVKGPNGSTSTTAVSIGDGLVYSGNLSVSPDLLLKLKDSNQKAIDQLKELKQKVQTQNGLDEVQQTAKEFDQQYRDFAAANVQAAVTKSIDSMAKVLDRLQVVANNLQTQINKLKQCIQGVSVDAEAGSGTAGGSVSASAPGCTDLQVDLNSGDGATSLQSKIDEIKSSMQTIRSFLSSSIDLIATLKDGNYSGTIASFQGVATVLDLVSSMSATVKNDLVNLAASVNK